MGPSDRRFGTLAHCTRRLSQGMDTRSMHDKQLPTRRTLRWLAMAAPAPLLSLAWTCIAARPNTTAASDPVDRLGTALDDIARPVGKA